MKRLKPYTIIPTGLYVERQADRQITEVINDKGRPGYVLVARQMGKTNLLLHAKQKLSSERHIVVYKDLSNKFATLREYFRSIVDTVISTNPLRLSKISNAVLENRNIGLPEFLEHEFELRQLLSFGQEITIILDEVDALTATGYSDQVFTQIRSVYFNRINFPELERLTYILSGVAEPSEIIKDKSISPFNIGQKIFLDDFTFEETERLVENAGVVISSHSLARVFYWANGNPRMTWEILSRCEDEVLRGGAVDEKVVDSIINSAYAQKFDIPPVDHIRDLVVASSELKNAVMTLHFGKGDTLTSNTLNKLYLAGIIGSDFSPNAIVIKNKIIELALSEEWLTSIERLGGSFIDEGHLLFKDGKYKDALSYYAKAIEQPGDIPHTRSVILHHMGVCHFELGEFEEALVCLEKVSFDQSEYKAIYYANKSQIGLCKFSIGKIEEALQIFEDCFENMGDLTAKLRVGINICACLSRLSPSHNSSRIIELSRRIIEKSENPSDFENPLESQRIATISFYNIGKTFQLLGKPGEAIEYYLKAYEISPSNCKIGILSQLVRVDKKTDYLPRAIECAEWLLSTRARFADSYLKNPLGLGVEGLLDVLSLVCREMEVFKRLFEYSLRFRKEIGNSEAQFLFNIIINLDNLEQPLLSRFNVLRFWRDSYFEASSPEEKQRGLLHICLCSPSDKVMDATTEYIEALEVVGEKIFSEEEFVEITNLTMQLIGSNLLSIGFRLISILKSFEKNTDESQRYRYILIDLAEVRLWEASRDSRVTSKLAQDLVVRISNCEIPKDSKYFTDTFKKQLLDAARQLAFSHHPRPSPVIARSKYERNQYIKVRYLDGAIKKIKFKHVKEDIAVGNCRVIDD